MTDVRDQDGFALIEVIVSAAVLALIALAVLTGIDGASQASARERARAQASALAEQDQERLRSMAFGSLREKGAPQQAPITLGGATYTVTSQATLITDDDGGVPACGDKSYRSTEYIKLVSTVTSSIVGVRSEPVRIESLLTSTSEVSQKNGTLTVRVNSGTTARAANTVVKLTGASTQQQTTNSDGCALFRSIPIGTYTVTATRSGYIDKQGNASATTTAIVNPNNVTAASLTYDKSVNMAVSIKTIKPGATFDATSIAAARASRTAAIADNAADPGTLRVYRPTPTTTWVSTLYPTSLYPFAAAYSFFTGSCGYESPTKANVAYTDYFNTINKAAAVIANPGATQQPMVATVYQPALNIRVRAGSANNAPTNFDPSTSRVWMTLPAIGGDTCSDIKNLPMKIADWPTATWGDQPTTPSGMNAKGYVWQNTSGDLDPGMPFGKYTICLKDSAGKFWTETYDNTSPSGRQDTYEIPPRTYKDSKGNTITPSWTTTDCSK